MTQSAKVAKLAEKSHCPFTAFTFDNKTLVHLNVTCLYCNWKNHLLLYSIYSTVKH